MARTPIKSHIDSPKAVGQRLRSARKTAGLSQRQLSFQGCTAAYISRVESGDRTPSLQMLTEFAKRLNVDTQWLAKGIEPEAEPEPKWDSVKRLEVSGKAGCLWLHLKVFDNDEGPDFGQDLVELCDCVEASWNEEVQAKASALVPPDEGLDLHETDLTAHFQLLDTHLELELNGEFEDEATAELIVAFAAQLLFGTLAALFCDSVTRRLWSQKLQVARAAAETRHRQSRTILENLPEE